MLNQKNQDEGVKDKANVPIAQRQNIYVNNTTTDSAER